MVQALDRYAIDTMRVLAADVTSATNSGHPGGSIGCAPMAHVLFHRFMNINPKNSQFINKDRFVLSNGHVCALQYIIWHFLGFDVSIDDLKSFRQLGSKCPGHPERGDTDGIDVTTGPLGQGIANGVGLAVMQEHMAAKYNRPGYEIFNNYTYVMLGDGCMQEGVASEAASLAGHWKLGKLICLYDDNDLSIDGHNEVQFSEDTMKRFESYGWHVLTVEDGNLDVEGIDKAIREAQAVTDKPSLIRVRTTIGYGALVQDMPKAHGSPLKADDIHQLKEKFGFDPEKRFYVPQEVYDFYAPRIQHGADYEAEWNELFEKYAAEYPNEAAEIKRRFAKELPQNWEHALPRFSPSDPPMATRKFSEVVLNALAPIIPDFTSGSADLTPSTMTKWKGVTDFQHPSTGFGDYAGQYFLYGVREHGMFAIMNGMACYGSAIPIGATFLNFLTYGWGAARLSALMHLRCIYVMTHDSIGIGEDGPTHQPIETLLLTRSTPNMLTIRPADGNETSGAYLCALRATTMPTILSLSRQPLPNLDGSSLEGVAQGAYVLRDQPNAKVILVGTGSEVAIAIEAAEDLAQKGIPARVVSMPCTELYDAQPAAYKEAVFTPGLPIVSVEALGVHGWERYAHAHVGMVGFGTSGPIKDLYQHFNVTADAVASKAEAALDFFTKLGYVPPVGYKI